MFASFEVFLPAVVEPGPVGLAQDGGGLFAVEAGGEAQQFVGACWTTKNGARTLTAKTSSNSSSV
ncbi:hypothetical protein, partial [Kitasatospora sp. NPDC004531]